jgi:hypothetical protein
MAASLGGYAAARQTIADKPAPGAPGYCRLGRVATFRELAGERRRLLAPQPREPRQQIFRSRPVRVADGEREPGTARALSGARHERQCRQRREVHESR